MNKLLNGTAVMIFLLGAISTPAFSETTVTVNDDRVTIDRNPSTVVVQPVKVFEPVPVQTVVVKSQDPREVEGPIIRVDYPGSEIVIEDIDGRERKILLKQGMINNYKVDDYVKIYLMADLREAKTIKTQHTADIEGNIVSLDYTTGRVVVRETAGDKVVIFKPAILHNYKAGDHVRLYVVTDDSDLKEAKMIRVK